MKRILLICFSLLTVNASLSAQGIVIFSNNGSQTITGDTLTFWYAEDPNRNEGATEFTANNFAKVVNASQDTMKIVLKRVVKTFIPTSEDYACWGSACYGGNDPSQNTVWLIPDTVVVASGDTASGSIPLVLYFDANNTTGEAIYSYVFYDADNPSDEAAINVKWSISTLTDINEITAAVQNMQVYPNPAVDNFTIDLNAGIQAEGQEIIIRDLLGKVVDRRSIGSTQDKFYYSTEGMTGGVYFVSYSIKGEILKTSKLIIK